MLPYLQDFFPFAFQYLQKIVNIRLFKNDSLIEFYLNIFFQIGRRIRDSCRNLRGKHPSGGASSNPDDFSTLQAPNVSSQKKCLTKKKFIIFFLLLQESNRSLHYVPMDFSGKSGRLISPKDIQGQRTKDGYTYFRRKIEARNVDHLLTETQANIHKEQPWFHKGVSRDIAQKILASHCVDG